jgi:hypothetical protein
MEREQIMALPQIFSGTLTPQLKILPGLRVRPRTFGSKRKTSQPQTEALTVNTLMAGLSPLPQHSVLLGRCADGLPFLMSLGDPELGAILIACERGYGKTHHVQALVDSALQSHSARKMQFAVLTLNPSEWNRLTDQAPARKYLQGLLAWYDPQAERLIADLTELAESRRGDQRRGPDVLLILDDLPALQDLSWEAQVNLRWLLEYGAQSGIWVVATVNATEVSGFRFWIDTFRTRILGRVTDGAAAEVLAAKATGVADLAPGQFQAWTGSSWTSYTLPMLGKVKTLED